LVAASSLIGIPAHVLSSISAANYTDFYMLFQLQQYPAAEGFIAQNIFVAVYLCWYVLQSMNNG